MCRRALRWLVALAAAGSGLASAQGLPPGPTADRPSPYDRDSVWPSRIVIDGLLSQGLVYKDRLAGRCGGAAQDRHWSVASIERSRLRVRSQQELGHGWLVAVALDSSLRPDRGAWGNGEAGEPCYRQFDAASTLSVHHPLHGGLALGRMQQPASALVEASDPWVGASTTSAVSRAYGKDVDQRSDGALTYYTPPDRPLRAAVHFGRQDDSSHRAGASLVWDRLPWLVGAGWQRRAVGGVTPLVVAYDSGWTRTSLGVVRGRAQGGEWLHVMAGLVLRRPYLGNPVGCEWRLALSRHEVKVRVGAAGSAPASGADDVAGADETKLSAGVRWQFRGAAWLSAGAAHKRGAGACVSGRSCPVFEVGLGWQFERDLSRSGTRASIPWQAERESP